MIKESDIPIYYFRLNENVKLMFGSVHMRLHTPREHVVHMVTCDNSSSDRTTQVVCASRDRAAERR
jgi:hypothetical protein